MPKPRQEAITDIPPGQRARVWCKDCHRELKDPISRLRRRGPECDPDRRTSTPDHDVDQDAIPGL